MIRHTVVFRLNHQLGSPEENAFLLKAAELSEIETVRNFECLRQISKKNSYTFGLSMEFASQEDYDFYNNHPDHVAFVEKIWLIEVAEFMEIDYSPHSLKS
ncbi:MAG: Dabb family protein [Planctomycetes bacterium]|nr:Dabb family protein [Planctomycetota bacterium]